MRLFVVAFCLPPHISHETAAECDQGIQMFTDTEKFPRSGRIFAALYEFKKRENLFN